MKFHKDNSFEIYLEDCRTVLSHLNLRNTVKIIVTSPPYKEEDGFSWELMADLIPLLKQSLRKDGLLYLNFGHLAENKSRPWRIVIQLEEAGFYWIDTITWQKKQYLPAQGNRRLDNKTEFIYVMAENENFQSLIQGTIFDNYLIQMASNKKNYELDRLSIGVPYEDKRNIGRYSDIDLHCQGNHWIMKYSTIQWHWQKRHPNRFPKELVRNCIKLSKCQRNDILLDPFCGSGTSIEVGVFEFGLYGIGIEKKEEEYENMKHLLISTKRLV